MSEGKEAFGSESEKKKRKALWIPGDLAEMIQSIQQIKKEKSETAVFVRVCGPSIAAEYATVKKFALKQKKLDEEIERELHSGRGKT